MITGCVMALIDDKNCYTVKRHVAIVQSVEKRLPRYHKHLAQPFSAAKILCVSASKPRTSFSCIAAFHHTAFRRPMLPSPQHTATADPSVVVNHKALQQRENNTTVKLFHHHNRLRSVTDNLAVDVPTASWLQEKKRQFVGCVASDMKSMVAHI